jgi:quinol monooxygenase YgiN
MVYAFVQDVAASWMRYQAAARLLDEPTPVGLMLHVAGPTEEGVRMIEIWTDEEACQRYRAERLEPVIATLGVPASAEASFRDLHPGHVVIGDIATPTTREGARR